jgi:hypothetical protein
MGHTPSKPSKSESVGVVSRPAYNMDCERQQVFLPVTRRASVRPTTSTYLDSSGMASSSTFHRRARSTAAASRTMLNPPPYSAVAPPMSPPTPRPPRPPLYPSTRHPASNSSSQPTQPAASTSRSSPNSTSAAVPATRNTYLRTPMRQDSKENALETLRKYNTVFLVDDSRSMCGQLWSEVCWLLCSGFSSDM